MPDGRDDTSALVDSWRYHSKNEFTTKFAHLFSFPQSRIDCCFFLFKNGWRPSLFSELVWFICIFPFFSSTQFSRPNKTLYLQIITLFQEAQSFLKEIYENPLRGGLHYSNSRCSRCEEGRRLLNLLVSPMRPHPCLSSNFLRGKRIRMIKKKPRKIFARKFQVLRLNCSSSAEFLTQAYSSEKCLIRLILPSESKVIFK